MIVDTDSGAAPVCLLLAEEVWGSPLHAARSLAQDGFRVLIAVAGEGAAILGRSRSCSAAIDLDPGDPGGFCTAAVRWVEDVAPGMSPVVVVPLSDRLVAHLDASRAVFPDRFLLAIPDGPICDELLDKERSLAAAERAGLDVPAYTVVARGADTAETAGPRLPVVVRPTSWATVGDDPFKIAVHRDRDTLAAELRTRTAGGARLLVQEYLAVPESAVEFAILWRSQDASVTAICTGRKRRQSAAGGGVMVWGETTSADDVTEAAERFLDITGFTGLGGIEFIRDDGRLWFVEFNPRLEAIHFLAAWAGLDTVPMAVHELISGRVPRSLPRPERATAWLGSAWLERLRNDRAGRRDVLLDRWRFARSPRRVRAVWSWRDPGPGFALARRLIVRALRQLRPAVGGRG